jgi:hypothetical protein
LRGDRAQKTGVGEFRGVTMGVDGPVGSGRSLRLDPFALPARYAARDGGADGQVRQIDLDRERVILMRAVRGIPMKVRLPVNEFRGVTLRALPAEGAEPAAVAIMLEHRDNALSVPLFVAPEGDEVLAQWKAWGRVLGVPLLVVEDDGSLREPFRRLGRIGLGAPSPRQKRRAAIRWRRPSTLMRRKPGRPSVQPQVHRGEREIIARD